LNANFEQTMGYQPPASDKPHKAYTKAGEWKTAADVEVVSLTASFKAVGGLDWMHKHGQM
jgi:hypothetical protein